MRRYDDAERHFDCAFRLNRNLKSELWLTHTLYDRAGMLRQRGRAADRREALELARRASTDASRLGLPDLARRALELVDQLR